MLNLAGKAVVDHAVAAFIKDEEEEEAASAARHTNLLSGGDDESWDASPGALLAQLLPMPPMWPGPPARRTATKELQ